MLEECLLSRRDIEFLLYELIGVETLTERARYRGQDRETYNAVIAAAAKLAAEEFAPHAAKLDQQEPEYDNGEVDIIPEVKAALDAYVEAGFMGASFDEKWGGMQLPWIIAQVCAAYFNAANVATAAYPFLTIAAANLLAEFGSEDLKARYLKDLIGGRFFGSMCLTEPHAGSSLSDIRTRAVPTGNGDYFISGTKMWVSATEHQLAENIVHLVLARIADAPVGVKGISLFLVPKFLVDANGECGAHNDVFCAGLNRKMGYRGTVNAVLNFGDGDSCRGWLIGEPHCGLSYMFHMMNEARVGVGLGATALGYAGYLHSLHYARERAQGRHPENKDPASPQVPIVEHADIKRLLLSQKSAVEGALALTLYCAYLLDLQRSAETKEEYTQRGLFLDLLTPIAKSWPSEFCLEANKHAIQVLGGAGYSSDHPVERFYRDNRLNPIHEGAHGIHGIDLLGRKVTMHGGSALERLFVEIDRALDEAAQFDQLAEDRDSLRQSRLALETTTERLLAMRAAGELRRYLANASLYLDAFGHIVIAWQWLRMATVAAAALRCSAHPDDAFYRGKIQACRFFTRYELSRVPDRLNLLARGDETCLSMQDAWF